MHNRIWLDELHRQLAHLKLPAAYVTRLVEELSDHLTDSQEDAMSMDALQGQTLLDRFGAPAEIAHRARAEFRRRTFSGRHPILMFVVLPLATLQIVVVASILAMVAVGGMWKSFHPELSSDALTPLGVAVMRLACTLVLVVPITLTAALFAWVAARTTVNRQWPIMACVLLGLIAAASQMDVYLSPLDGQSRVSVGFGFSTALSSVLFQAAKLAAILGAGFWIFSRYPNKPALDVPSS